MRTTVLLPDDLYREVKQLASREARTVTSVIEESLRTALRDRDAQASHPDFAVDVITGGRLQVGVDLDDNAVLADLMDSHDRR